MSEQKPSVFISYASEDSIFVELVKMKLIAASIEVWLDQDSLNAGEEWRKGIDQGIVGCDALIVVLTPESTKSSYVTYEWAYALGRMKKVIPVLFKEAEIHPRLNVLQYLDFTNQKNAPWQQLFKEIEKSKVEVKTDNSPSNLVGSMTIEALKRLLSGTVSLANATAKQEGRNANQQDINEAASNIANANSNLKYFDDKSKTILWVDDRPNNNINERAAFSSIGFDFDLALSTNEALLKLNSKTYCAIISDMGRMEGPQEGYVLLEKIRKKDKEIPFFIYAGSNLLEHKKEAERRGAQGSTNRAQELINLVTSHLSDESRVAKN